MSKFFVFYFATDGAMEQMKSQSPERSMEMMKKWFDWKDQCGDALIDLGGPLMNGQLVTRDGTGPSRSGLGSYSILEAENMDEAMKLLEDHPHLHWIDGCSLEVFESLPPPQM